MLIQRLLHGSFDQFKYLRESLTPLKRVSEPALCVFAIPRSPRLLQRGVSADVSFEEHLLSLINEAVLAFKLCYK